MVRRVMPPPRHPVAGQRLWASSHRAIRASVARVCAACRVQAITPTIIGLVDQHLAEPWAGLDRGDTVELFWGAPDPRRQGQLAEVAAGALHLATQAGDRPATRHRNRSSALIQLDKPADDQPVVLPCTRSSLGAAPVTADVPGACVPSVSRQPVILVLLGDTAPCGPRSRHATGPGAYDADRVHFLVVRITRQLRNRALR